MTTTVACRRCGRDITPEMPEGVCACCLLAPALLTTDGPGEWRPFGASGVAVTQPGATGTAGVSGGESAAGEPAGVSDAGGAAPDDVDAPLPDVSGYRIARLIGAGGIGEVYEAEQHHPHRVVALKLLKPSLGMRETLRRLRYEADVLGRLQHPGIAQIYESGFADGGGHGRPFFAMELVRGPGGAEPLTITAYADRERLDVRGRLALLALVADAVHFAHQRGVVHRDLKPANVLVDEHGHPKVVDFGVARVSSADTGATTLHTQFGQIVGTLAYMSPEQAGGTPSEVDTRADVYALGAIAYDLLGGRLPVALEGLMIHEAVRAIRETEPPRLGSLDPALRGDVETVVGKALAKEKERRYSSAADFAADLRRCLEDRPVAARPPTAVYYLRKTLRRHRLAAWAACAVVVLVAALVLVGAAGVSRARAAAALAHELARHEALGNTHWRSGRLKDARREFEDALSVANRETDRARIRLALAQADERLGHSFHGVPFRVGQIIRAEHFDTGGEGVSYHDTDGPNNEDHARTDTGVDVINGVLSYVRTNEWVEYTIEVRAEGRYEFECLGGNTFGPAGVMHVEFDGVDKTGSVQLPGPLPTYAVFRSRPFQLAAGRQVMRVFFEAEAPQGYVGGLEWFQIVPSTGRQGKAPAEPGGAGN